MLIHALAVVAGFALLMWGADRFVAGAATTARNLGVSPLIVGLTIVGFGTSAPEMLVSATAAWQGNPGLAVGNAVGSNITNIGLILGVTALITPLEVHSGILKRELPVLLGVMILSLVLLLNGRLGRMDGVILLAAMVILIAWITRLALRGRDPDPLAQEYAQEIPSGMGTTAALGWVALGLVVLVASSRILVWGAVGIAHALNVSDLIIGLTVVALGTSLPELAASVASARKGEHDIAIGNVIGSNMFNLLAVLGLPGLIRPALLDPQVLTRDFPVMFAFTVGLFLLAYGFRTPGRITRLEGLLLVVAYCAYETLLYFSGRPPGV
ncbi:MAG TPA: calcium/sodium antiporter [Gammaproteobacteria bacterium]|nr:calcium/sodium antiporter [Gammaproteobacteria bacterium]